MRKIKGSEHFFSSTAFMDTFVNICKNFYKSSLNQEHKIINLQ